MTKIINFLRILFIMIIFYFFKIKKSYFKSQINFQRIILNVLSLTISIQPISKDK